MAQDKKKNVVHEKDPAADALAGLMQDAAGDTLKDVPSEFKKWASSLMGGAARLINGYIGEAAGAFAAGFGKNDQDRKKYALWGERIVRGALVVLPTRIMPAIQLTKDLFSVDKNIKKNFSFIKDDVSTLEVMRYEQQNNSRAISLRARSWFSGLFTAIPSLAINEMEMVINNVERQNNYKHHQNILEKSDVRSSEYYTSKKIIERLDRENQKTGAVFNDYREKQATKINEKLDQYSWLPDGTGNNAMIEMIVGADPTYSGNKENLSRVDFLKYTKYRLGLVYDTIGTKWLGNIIGDKHTPEAVTLLKKNTAAKMIKSLETPFKDHASPSRVTLPGASEKNCLVGDYVYDIFMRHRADMGLAELSELNKERLREACDVIAAAMQDGNRRLHPQALAYLVDSKRGIMTQAAGKGVDVKQGEDLEKMIQSLISDKQLTGKPTVKAEEYYQSEGRGGGGMVRFTRAEMQTSWNNLSDEQQQIWSTNFPDAVLEDITGNKDYARSLRMKHNDCWQEMFEEATLAIHNLSQRDLQQAGITAGMQKELAELNRELKRDTKNALYDNQARVMDLTAEICVRMDTANSGFLTEMIDNAMARKAKKEGFGHELDSHVEESYHFRNKVGERSREEREHASKETREPREHAKDKIIKSRRHSHDEVGEEASYHGR